MAFTVQNIVDRARVPLNDAAKTRNPDSELLDYFNACLTLFRKYRPDLFVGQFSALPGNLVIGATFPLSDEYMTPFVDYIVARAEAKNVEFAEGSRGMLFLSLFEKGLM